MPKITKIREKFQISFFKNIEKTNGRKFTYEVTKQKSQMAKKNAKSLPLYSIIESTLVQHNKQYHRKVLLSSFHLNGHTLGFYPQTQKLEPPCTA